MSRTPVSVFLLLSLASIVVFGCASAAPLAPRAVELNQSGVEALQSGDLEKASARFALALEFHPRFVDALVNLGLVELQRGSFREARKRLEKAVAVNRHVAQSHHGLGVLSEREGDTVRATKHYRAALEVDPGFAPSRANLARIHFVEGRLDHAREQFLRLTEVAPEVGAGWAGLIESMQRLGRQQEADDALDRAVVAAPDEPEVRLYAARRAMRCGQWAEADRGLEELAGAGGALARSAWGWLGVSKLMQGERDHARQCAERAMAIDRDDALATYVMAMAVAGQKDPGSAAWMERATRLAPGNSVVAWELSARRSR